MKIHAIFHVLIFEPFHESTILGRHIWPLPLIDLNDKKKIEVKKILKLWIFCGCLEYLVHWYGYNVKNICENPLLTYPMHHIFFENFMNKIHLNLDQRQIQMLFNNLVITFSKVLEFWKLCPKIFQNIKISHRIEGLGGFWNFWKCSNII